MWGRGVPRLGIQLAMCRLAGNVPVKMFKQVDCKYKINILYIGLQSVKIYRSPIS